MIEEDANARMRRLVTDQQAKPLPRRFYAKAEASEDNTILLDGRSVKTPLKAALRLPNKRLAEAVSLEWASQVDVIDPALMPLTRFANTAIDRAVPERESVIADLLNYTGSDLVCYRAETPSALAKLQAHHWDPVVAEIRRLFEAPFRATTGIVYVEQPPEALKKIEAVLRNTDPFQLTALYNLTTLTGSSLLSLLLLENAITPEEAWAAAHVDEDYQIQEWGADSEAMARREGRKRDFDALIQFLILLRQN
jgi:chaperone required for assembly of F1-ATPase